MEQFEIVIWKWREVLHRGIFEFKNVKEATQYELGLFEGFRLSGMKPSGMSCTRVEEESFILGYDKPLDEELTQYDSEGQADYEAEEWVKVFAPTLEEAKTKYEEAFKAWQEKTK